MKRAVLFLAVVFISVSLAFALEQAKISPAMPIEGFVDTYHSMTITTIESTSTTTDTGRGMPFDLAWPSLSYTPILGTGRLVGTWSLTSNYTPISLSIEASPMTLVSEASSDEVNYCLDFHYKTIEFDTVTKLPTGGMIEGDFRVESGTAWNSSSTAPFNVSEGIPVVTVEQDVRFCLASNFDYDSIAPGIYAGTVTMTVIGE
ncbi:MAG: hypothetical protein IJ831_04740 [Spirochaetales bacterium]|nr:hypothetical protein [Spirochaetales bacterium]